MSPAQGGRARWALLSEATTADGHGTPRRGTIEHPRHANHTLMMRRGSCAAWAAAAMASSGSRDTNTPDPLLHTAGRQTAAFARARAK